ncbi:MAG: methylated-DNA--[protein]-cysteine S-methyltransferase [Dehalococcoidales bacterium]|nr:MAG: methylated-DNA--[protein]-cysteine S-methyltransferase [Dehalococcoidales bacterium]
MSDKLTYTVFQTDAGWMAVMASERGLVRATLPRASSEDALKALGEYTHKATRTDDRFVDLAARLQSYFRGGKPSFPDKLDLSKSTPFQQAVWEGARRIPYGETRSYGELAEEVGRPGAARAVGQAMSRNPVAIVIPCHRVIASGGKLGGFGKRLDLKWSLLSLETDDLPPDYPKG